MGGGYYDSTTRSMRATSMGYDTKAREEIFTSKHLNDSMNPAGVVMRESRDSADHPESLAIVVALDVTGSMGDVPHQLVKTGLPKLMDAIIKGGLKDPQVLFLGVGDHECDNAPLQVGQFESADEPLDKWLTTTWLEGGGGGNRGESYPLAWYFAGKKTSIDCLEKRGVKGLLFTIGDERYLNTFTPTSMERIFGKGDYEDLKAADFLRMAQAKYEVYHLNVLETGASRDQKAGQQWKKLLGDNCIDVENQEDIPELIASIVSSYKPTRVKPTGTTDVITPRRNLK